MEKKCSNPVTKNGEIFTIINFEIHIGIALIRTLKLIIAPKVLNFIG